MSHKSGERAVSSRAVASLGSGKWKNCLSFGPGSAQPYHRAIQRTLVGCLGHVVVGSQRERFQRDRGARLSEGADHDDPRRRILTSNTPQCWSFRKMVATKLWLSAKSAACCFDLTKSREILAGLTGRGFRNGYTYLEKPFAAKELLSIVRTALNQTLSLTPGLKTISARP